MTDKHNKNLNSIRNIMEISKQEGRTQAFKEVEKMIEFFKDGTLYEGKSIRDIIEQKLKTTKERL